VEKLNHWRNQADTITYEHQGTIFNRIGPPYIGDAYHNTNSMDNSESKRLLALFSVVVAVFILAIILISKGI
jgi:hypothetical protein